MRNIKITFSNVTPESAEDGDFSETGFIDEEGIFFPDTEDENGIEETIRFLKNEGCFFPSSSFFHSGIWYTTESETIDYQTGETQERSFHLYDYTAQEEETIYKALTERKKL